MELISGIDSFTTIKVNLLPCLKTEELSAKGQQYILNTDTIINGLDILYMGAERLE